MVKSFKYFSYIFNKTLKIILNIQENRSIREKENEEREKMKVSVGNKSPRNGSTTEQRNYCNKVQC